VVYNVECSSEDDQAKVGRALELTHEKYCGMVQMLRRIAPVSREIAVVSTQPAKA
jgi:putative redox protein